MGLVPGYNFVRTNAAKRIEKELAQGRLFCPDEKKPKTGSLFIDENRKGKAQ